MFRGQVIDERRLSHLVTVRSVIRVSVSVRVRQTG
jgi:hypothetical protein